VSHLAVDWSELDNNSLLHNDTTVAANGPTFSRSVAARKTGKRHIESTSNPRLKGDHRPSTIHHRPSTICYHSEAEFSSELITYLSAKLAPEKASLANWMIAGDVGAPPVTRNLMRGPNIR
jgi:hypothetical protein